MQKMVQIIAKKKKKTCFLIFEWTLRMGVSCWSHVSQPVMLHLCCFYKDFSLHPLSLPPPPGLWGCLGPPRRLQTDVLGEAEHALLDVTRGYRAVEEAKGLSAFHRPQFKRHTIVFSRSVSSLQKSFGAKYAVGIVSVQRHKACWFKKMFACSLKNLDFIKYGGDTRVNKPFNHK